MPQQKTITCKLKRFEGNLWHYHVLIPADFAAQFIQGNQRRVVCTLNEKEVFQAALMPLGDENYFINVNKKIRDKLKLKEGNELTVALKPDESEYGLPVPEEFAELLNQDSEGADIFKNLTAGKQRTLLYIAGSVKSSDLRIKRSIAILTHLKENNGNIDYKRLNILLKS